MKVKAAGTVLCFNFEEAKFRQLEALCRKQGHRIRAIDPSTYNRTLGELAGFITPKEVSKKFQLNVEEGPQRDAAETVAAAENDHAFDEELMVIYNMPGTILDKLLNACKQQKLDIPYKAMLTGTNAEWYPDEMAAQIADEHNRLSRKQ